MLPDIAVSNTDKTPYPRLKARRRESQKVRRPDGERARRREGGRA
jgi:hypothetical protein